MIATFFNVTYFKIALLSNMHVSPCIYQKTYDNTYKIGQRLQLWLANKIENNFEKTCLS